MERYPPDKNTPLVGADIVDNYVAAETYINKIRNEPSGNLSSNNTMKPDLEPIFILEDIKGQDICLGTLSKEEWDAVTLYCVFAFKKKSEKSS